jgi:predicted PolB exonuclease-like 3'-5' exonuclease
MYTKEEIKSMLFIDIETTSGFKTLDELKESHPELISFWDRKEKFIRAEDVELRDAESSDIYFQKASLTAEWGRIVCISVGQIKFDENDVPFMQKKSFYGSDEKELLVDFVNFMSQVFFKAPGIKLVGHNIKGFDLPYIIKKSILYSLELPRQLHLHKVKPWENCLIDTYEVWKAGGWSSAALAHLCLLLGIKNPKDDMNAGEVGAAFYAGRIEEIKNYCEEDIEAAGSLMLKFANMSPIRSY